MISQCALVLALAVFGASATLVTPGFGATGLTGGYGGFGATVADTCRCVKTVVRPQFQTFGGPIVERIPYAVSRTVNTPTFTQAAGVFPTQITSVLPTTGVCGAGVLSGSVGLISGTGVCGAGYLNGGLLNTVY